MSDILAVGAHPDDIELGCGGILAKAVSQGLTLTHLVITDGANATNGTPEIRQQEAKKGGALIGAQTLFLELPDGHVCDDHDTRLQVAAVIRTVRPQVILTSLGHGFANHPDHIACGKLTRSAVRYARFSTLLPEMPIHVVGNVLHYLGPQQDNPDFLIDISEHVEVWKEMIGAHASQQSTLPYLDLALRKASYLGTLIGRPYAQGLACPHPIEIESLLALARGPCEL